MKEKLDQAIIDGKFRTLSFICACLVALIHVYAQPEAGSWWNVFYGIVGGGAYGTGGLVRIAVPFFFIASGYYLEAHYEQASCWRREVIKRVRTLVVPFLVWATVLLFYYICKDVLADRSPMHWFGIRQLSSAYGLDLRSAPIGPYWYLRYLFMLVIISPFVRKLATVPGLIALFILYGAICPTTWLVTLPCPMFWLYGFSLLGLFYFTLGIYLRRNPAALCMKRTPAIVSLASSFVLFVLHYLLLRQGLQIEAYACYLGIPLALLGLFNLMSQRPLSRQVASLGFPLYMLHWPMIDALRIVCGKTCASGGGVILWFLVVSSCVLAIVVFRNCFPGVYRISFGGR